MTRVTRSKLMLILAMLKELNSKVMYYASMVERSIDRYRDFAKRIEKIDPVRAKQALREASSLEALRGYLNRLSIFLENVMLRIETLVMMGDVAACLALVRNLVEELRKGAAYRIPFISIVVDNVDNLAREVVEETKVRSSNLGKSFVSLHSEEARKVIEEAKKVAGLT